MNNIYLCGFMGCGKTTVGKRLAAKTGRPFFDLDEVIKHDNGEISEIFKIKGENGFRRIEADALLSLSKQNGAIISCGGGTVTADENIAVMKESGKIIFIDVPFSHCAARILGDSTRPLTSGGRERLFELYNARIGIYTSCADVTLKPEKSPDKTAAKIASLVFGEGFRQVDESYNMYVCVPLAMMTSESGQTSKECADELLFGTHIKILEKGSNALCETEYGYRGYLTRSNYSSVSPTYCGERKTVFSSWCDLLPTPEYKYAPIMTLPRGSTVDITGDANERFFEVMLGKAKYFARKFCFESPFSETSQGEKIAAAAKLYIGTPYRWGGKSPSGIDCSGLAFMAHYLCGITIFRDSDFDGKYMDKIAFDELSAGDLVYFDGHIAIYLGDGKIIHASATVGEVIIQSLAELAIKPCAFGRSKRME